MTYMTKRYPSNNETQCELCGERFRPNDARAEMYDPDADLASVICHAECGLSRGFEVA